MGYEAALEVLADPTRRTLVERLRSGPVAVGDLAAGLPVSRPAVSKHLRLMLDAGVVTVSQAGTKRLYELDVRGLKELRNYVEGFWDDVLGRFKDAAEGEKEMTMVTTPVTKTLVLKCTPERAFAVFTDEIETWWPLETHSVYKQDARSLTFEPHQGGRLVETNAAGDENPWAIVAVWDPPNRIVFSWSPDTDKSVQTEVEVRFAADAQGTRFELIHRGWEKWGEQAEAHRNGYDGGWVGVLEKFAAATG